MTEHWEQQHVLLTLSGFSDELSHLWIHDLTKGPKEDYAWATRLMSSSKPLALSIFRQPDSMGR